MKYGSGMSMEELLRMEEELPEGAPGEPEVRRAVVPAEPAWWHKLVRAKTGPGPVADYQDHPLNLRRSPGLARVIRGLTGMLGELELAIIDIVVGLLEFGGEGRAGPGAS